MEHGRFLVQNSIGEDTHDPEKRPTEAGLLTTPPPRAQEEEATFIMHLFASHIITVLVGTSDAIKSPATRTISYSTPHTDTV